MLLSAAVNRLHQREHAAAIKLQCKYRGRQGQLLAHMKARIQSEENDRKEQLEQAARRIQSAWRRKTGQMARHLLKQAKKQLKEELKLELKAAQTIHVW